MHTAFDLFSKDYDALTNSELDARNEIAWDRAKQAIRDALARDTSRDFDDAQRAAYADLKRSADGYAADIARAQRTRATKAEKAYVPSYEAHRAELEYAMNFVYDIESV